jgi:hypothetical protein
MIRTKVLDQGQDVIISDAILDLMDELGFSAEEMIPGLIYATTLLAEKTFDPEAALDDAANLLADTGRV